MSIERPARCGKHREFESGARQSFNLKRIMKVLLYVDCFVYFMDSILYLSISMVDLKLVPKKTVSFITSCSKEKVTVNGH